MIDGIRYLEWQPQKRGSTFVSMPMHDLLLNEFVLHELGDTYLRTEAGRPFASTASLGNRVRKWIVQAGLCVAAKNAKGEMATRSQHGIRKGVAEMMAEAGASVYEIGAGLAHAETKTTERYTRKVDRRKLAAEAARKRADNEGVPRHP